MKAGACFLVSRQGELRAVGLQKNPTRRRGDEDANEKKRLIDNAPVMLMVANYWWFQLGWKRDNKSSHVTWRVLINYFLLVFLALEGKHLSSSSSSSCSCRVTSHLRDLTLSQQVQRSFVQNKRSHAECRCTAAHRCLSSKTSTCSANAESFTALMNTVFSSCACLIFGLLVSAQLKVKHKPIRTHFRVNEWRIKLIWFGNLLKIFFLNFFTLKKI